MSTRCLRLNLTTRLLGASPDIRHQSHQSCCTHLHIQCVVWHTPTRTRTHAHLYTCTPSGAWYNVHTYRLVEVMYKPVRITRMCVCGVRASVRGGWAGRCVLYEPSAAAAKSLVQIQLTRDIGSLSFSRATVSTVGSVVVGRKKRPWVVS